MSPMATTSTIIVMGPPGSGKTSFIKLLGEPVNIQPVSRSAVASQVAITISPYLLNGQIVRLVKFPGFSNYSMNPTDAERLAAISTFLEIQRKTQQSISGVVYMHRGAISGPEADRNLKMLSLIAGKNGMKNVVVATDSSSPLSLLNAANSEFQRHFSPNDAAQFKKHDGTKLSAAGILDAVFKNTPENLLIQTELETDNDPMSTTAGQGLIDDINDFISVKQAEDRQTRRDIAAARRAKDKNQENTLDAKLTGLGGVLDSLKKEQDRLKAPVNWEQAEADNASLEIAMKDWYDMVTTDWKAKYDKLVVEYDAIKAKYDKLVVEYDTLKNDATAKIELSVEHFIVQEGVRNGFPVKLRTKVKHTSTWSTWLTFEANELLMTNDKVMDEAGYRVIRARNVWGKIGSIFSPALALGWFEYI